MLKKSKESQIPVKNKRNTISPIFHMQTKGENEKYLSKEIIKVVKKTGVLNLHGKHLSHVPDKIFTMYDSSDSHEVNLDFGRGCKEENDLWWNSKPLTNLDLSSNVLTEIPGQIGIFQDLTVLNLQDNSLTSLPAEITTLTKLTKLSLNHNKINKLPKDIDKLFELRVLNLSHNSISMLPNSFVDLVMLEKLDLSHNTLESLPSGIGFLVRLNELDTSYNRLVEVPPDIVNLRSLAKLDLNHNSIKNLPESLGELRRLQILYAQHNDIEEIPDFTGCECIQEIYFGNNYIKEIPPEMCDNMPHLKVLDLRDNKIDTLPKELTKLMHLNKLDVTNNDLTKIPAALSLLPHLQSLKIEGNKLKYIRPDIVHTGTQRLLQFLRETLSDDDLTTITCGAVNSPAEACVFPDRYRMRNGNILNLPMKNLSNIPDHVFMEAKEAHVSVVDLCKNKLSQFPLSLLLLADYLTELNLSTNQLNEIPAEVAKLSKLKFLDLSNNRLNDLPLDMDSMKHIRELVLFNNRFKKIPDCIFGMIGLEILMLNDNKLDEINIDGLQKLIRLATLSLSNNNISIVPPELGNMSHLRSLELKGNSFRQPRYAILEQGTESILSYLRDKIPR
ncbi:leucine-rich repeat-containing protein 40-like isoform X1 [Euwallacea similis]|uniref:leucine-rich repeat-containing protein 40-like isoform X1 n=1 Tax=Euwallacea similis TaxID=1736056 RepID=UPI00344F6167